MKSTDEGTEALILRAYEAAQDRSQLSEFLGTISHEFNAHAVWMRAHDDGNYVTRCMESFGLPAETLNKQESQAAKRNPWREGGTKDMLAHGVGHGETVLPHRDLKRTEYYHEILKPLDIEYGMGFLLWAEPPQQAVVISLNRARWQGGGFADDLPRARRILPYFRSAYAVMRRLSWAETQIRTFESAIDRLGVGMALVDADARCGYYNAAAEYAISARQGLSLVGGTFRCTTPDALRSLCAALTLAAQGALPSPQRIHIRNAAGVLRFVLIVTMLRGGTMGLGARRGNPCAAIFIHAPSAVPESPETLLQQAFGLTRAEARLAALLAVGMPPNQCAETLRVSLATIRTQIRSLFGKTGARRHGELVSLSEFVLRSR